MSNRNQKNPEQNLDQKQKELERLLEEVRVTAPDLSDFNWADWQSVMPNVNIARPGSSIPNTVSLQYYVEKIAGTDLDPAQFRPVDTGENALGRKQALEDADKYLKDYISDADIDARIVFYWMAKLGRWNPLASRILDAVEVAQAIYDLVNLFLFSRAAEETALTIADVLNSTKGQTNVARTGELQQALAPASQGKMEHVLVIADRVYGNSVTRTFTMDWAQAAAAYNRYAAPHVRSGAAAMTMAGPTPYVETKTGAMPANLVEAWETPLPNAYVDMMEGSFSFTATADGFKAGSTVNIPTAEGLKDENKSRKDQKQGNAATLYRSILWAISRTYGAYTEIEEFLMAILDNIWVGTRRLTDYPWQMWGKILNFGDWRLDWEKAARQIAYLELEDRVFGKTAKAQREALNAMGYWGPNAGSYLPNQYRNRRDWVANRPSRYRGPKGLYPTPPRS